MAKFNGYVSKNYNPRLAEVNAGRLAAGLDILEVGSPEYNSITRGSK